MRKLPFIVFIKFMVLLSLFINIVKAENQFDDLLTGGITSIKVNIDGFTAAFSAVTDNGIVEIILGLGFVVIVCVFIYFLYKKFRTQGQEQYVDISA